MRNPKDFQFSERDGDSPGSSAYISKGETDTESFSQDDASFPNSPRCPGQQCHGSDFDKMTTSSTHSEDSEGAAAPRSTTDSTE